MGVEIEGVAIAVLVGSRIVTLYEGGLDLRLLHGTLVLSLVSSRRFIAPRLSLGRSAGLVRILVGVWPALSTD